jgi:hypothetical protein
LFHFLGEKWNKNGTPFNSSSPIDSNTISSRPNPLEKPSKAPVETMLEKSGTNHIIVDHRPDSSPDLVEVAIFCGGIKWLKKLMFEIK